MSNLKKLAGDTAIYGISSIVGRLLNYLLVPVYTSVFVPAEYGIVTELYAYVAFFMVLYTYGMETAYFRYANKEQSDEKEVFNTAVTAILTSSVLLSGLLVLLATPLINALQYPGKEHYIYWFAAILAIDAVVAIPFARLRYQKKPVTFATAKLINIGLNIGLNLFFIVFCKEVYEGRIFSGLKPWVASFYDPDFAVSYVFLSNLIASAALVFILWKQLAVVRFRLDRGLLKPMLVYAYPLLFMGLAGVTNEMLSRAMLKSWLPEGFYREQSNLAALGIFGACYKLSVFMTLGIQAFRYASEPFFFSQAKDKNSPELFSRVMHWFVIAGSFVFLAVSINLDIISKVFLRGEDYRDGLEVVPVLLLANLFLGVYYNLSIWFKLTDKTYFGSWISIGGAFCTILLNMLLIPVMGYLGSSLVTLFVYFSMSLISYLLGNKHYPIPYKVKTGLAYISGTTLLTYGVMQVAIADQFLATGFHIFVMAVFVAVVFLLEKEDLPTKTLRFL